MVSLLASKGHSGLGKARRKCLDGGGDAKGPGTTWGTLWLAWPRSPDLDGGKAGLANQSPEKEVSVFRCP